MIKVLGIESSCDDTAASIIAGGDNTVTAVPRILSNIVISQNNEHAIYQGVVPEIASRSHMKNLKTAVNAALDEAKIELKDIDAIASTCGPGLIGGVIVGAMFGKALASVLKKPFIAINHLEGHVLTAKLTHQIQYPYLLLLASGGHCQYVAVLGLGQYKILGQTMDDALGEAFDKVAKMMGLGFPGGPEIEEYAKRGNESRFTFPQPMINSNSCDMSFSGLKTAVKLKINEIENLSEQDIADIAASFQKTVSKIIHKKTIFAIKEYEKIATGKYLVVAGGVAANEMLRNCLANIALQNSYNFVAPPRKLCTDNAAMIAFAGLERLNNGIINNISFKPRARWGLEELSESL